MANFCSHLPTHIGNQGAGPTAKNLPHPGSLGEEGWENLVTGHAPHPPTNIPTPWGENPRRSFCREPGTLTSPRENPSQSCRHIPPRQGGPHATRSERVSTWATIQDRHALLSPPHARRAAEGGTWGQIFPGSPRHSPSGGGTLEKQYNLPRLGERPPGPPAQPAPPPHARLTSEGGGAWRPSISRVLAAPPAPLPRRLRSVSNYVWPPRA